jgi:hypothetical protein
MNAQALLEDFSRRGIRLIPNPPRLTVEPASRLTDVDRAAIRAAKSELLRLLVADGAEVIGERWLNASRLGREDDEREDEVDRVARNDGWRPPAEPPPDVIVEIRRIEAQALALGWSRGRLWNYSFWPHRRDEPRGLASILSEGDKIIEVFADRIYVENDDGRHTTQTFWRFH